MRTFIHLPGDSYPADAFLCDELAARLEGQWITLAPVPHDGRVADIEARMGDLEAFISKLNATEVILVGRSSGARVITQAAEHPAVRDRACRLICLGYPFRHPKRPAEPERVRHLAGLTLPTLILQGRQDAYGGLNVLTDYAFSAQVRLEFLDAEHALKKVWHEGWDDIALRITAFLRDVAPEVVAPVMPPVALTRRRA